MMAYGGTAGNAGTMGPSTGGGGGGGGGAEALGTAADYSPQSTPTPLTGHTTTGGSVENAYTPGATGAASYSPQDSPASSAGGSGNGQLPSFGFTQDQVACVCEVSRADRAREMIALLFRGDPPARAARKRFVVLSTNAIYERHRDGRDRRRRSRGLRNIRDILRRTRQTRRLLWGRGVLRMLFGVVCTMLYRTRRYILREILSEDL